MRTAELREVRDALASGIYDYDDLVGLCDEIERLKDIAALNGRRCLLWRNCARQLVACFDFAAEAPEALSIFNALEAD